jgi:hypothetical protein
MRKRMAVLLTLVMFLGTLNGMVVKAATPEFVEKYNYQLVKEGLADGENGLQPTTGLREKEAAVKWDMAQIGTYTLSYYIEQTGVTNKVEMTFEVDASDQVKMETKLSVPPAKFSYREYSAGKWIWKEKVPDGTNTFTYEELFLNSTTSTVGFEKQQLSFLAGTLPVKLMLKGRTIHLSTEGVEAGNITEFKLKYNDNNAVEEDSLKTIKGLKNFTVKPTHLTEGGGLDSQVSLTSGEAAGSKPGVRISFDKPKEVTGTQTAFTAIEGDNIKAVLNLWISTSPTGGSSSDTNNSITLKFGLGSNPQITDELGAAKGETQISGDSPNISVYVSESKYIDEVVQWDKLKASMLIGAGLTLEGGSIDELSNAEKSFSPQNNGHTYLEYSVFRSSESQVGIRIIPYNINGAVTYSLSQGASPGSLKKILDHYYPNKVNNTEPVYIYVPNISQESYYQLEADIGGQTILKSQITHFQVANETAPPSISRVETVNNIYAVPADEVGGQPQAAGFDITWQAPAKDELNSLLGKGDIYYELSFHRTKKEEREAEDSAVIKIFKVSKDGAAIKVETASGTAGEGRYSASGNVFEVRGVVLKNIDEAKWEQIDVAADRFTGDDYESGDAVDDMDYYEIPGTYYASINAIFDPDEPGKKIAQSQDSSDIAVPIDNVIEIIPVPSDIRSIDRSDISKLPPSIQYDIEMQKVDITSYVEKMLKPAGIYLEEPANFGSYKGIYEVFLYQKNQNKQSYTEADLEEAMSTPGAAVNVTTGSILTLNTEQLGNLRAGKVLPIRYEIPSLQGQADRAVLSLDNLDPNQVYYAKVRVRLEPFKAGESLAMRYSIFSKTHSFTTTALPQPPKPEDKVPPAPSAFYVDEQPNNTTAILKWGKAEFEPDQDMGNPHYELVRVTEAELKENEKSNTKTIESLTGDNDNIIGFSTKDDTILTIGGKAADWQQLSPVQSSNSMRLEDNSLSPNTIYYYYIRTVCIIENQAVRSQWIMVPVTSQPVERPIRLQVETPQKYSYEPKTETVISFLAPIPKDAKVPEEYEFEIAVQGELDDSFRSDYKTTLLTSKEDPNLVPSGYVHYVYKLHDLKPGRRYDIKVRIVDKTQSKPTNGDYPKSLYSEKAVVRTEFDEDDQEIDDKFDQYLKRYDDEVEKLRRKPYWEADGKNRFSVAYKYRESYINAELAVQNIYELQTDETMNSLTYYLPASMLDRASDFNVIINAALGNESISLRPYTLTADNEDIQEAVTKLNQKDIEDYYIQLEFTKMASAGKINGETVISSELVVDIELVYLEEEDMLIEDSIMIELNKLIERERKAIITLLEKELDKGKMDDDRLQDIIDDAVSDIKEDHLKETQDILEDVIDKKVTVDTIEKPILITSVLDSYAVNGYYLEGTWQSVEVIQANGGFTIEAYKLGIYAFTGKEDMTSTLPQLGMHQTLISKYSLTDFFVLDAYMIKTGVSKSQLYGAAARVLGAPRGTDYNEYLKGRGIKGVTGIGLDKGIRQDEAIYILMQAYEKIYNKPITAIQIKNRQSITNIGAFQVPYRPYVYAAVELKIVQNTGSQVLPSKAMSVEEIIKILSAIVPK